MLAFSRSILENLDRAVPHSISIITAKISAVLSMICTIPREKLCLLTSTGSARCTFNKMYYLFKIFEEF